MSGDSSQESSTIPTPSPRSGTPKADPIPSGNKGTWCQLKELTITKCSVSRRKHQLKRSTGLSALKQHCIIPTGVEVLNDFSSLHRQETFSPTRFYGVSSTPKGKTSLDTPATNPHPIGIPKPQMSTHRHFHLTRVRQVRDRRVPMLTTMKRGA